MKEGVEATTTVTYFDVNIHGCFLQPGGNVNIQDRNSHVWVVWWTFDLKFYSHITFLAVVQAFRAQTEMHLRRSFHLRWGRRGSRKGYTVLYCTYNIVLRGVFASVNSGASQLPSTDPFGADPGSLSQK